MTAPAASTPQPSARWLFGPVTDLSFGYGLAYLVSVPLFVWLGLRGVGTPAEWVTPALALAISAPHYGATLLRVYERSEDRSRYRLFAVWISLVLAGLFVASLFFGTLGSILLTVYVTWAPWHFSGQNYGLFLMYMRRAGIEVTPVFKRTLYFSFLVTALVSIVGMHQASATASFAARSYDSSGTFEVMRLGIPQAMGVPLSQLLAGAFLVCVGWLATRLIGVVQWRYLVPLILLMSMQALWYLPMVASRSGFAYERESIFAFTAIWIAVAHAAQYLWVTFYYARREGRQRSFLAFYGKTLVASSVMMVPIFAMAPGLMQGIAPHATGVLVLTITMLNLHHFFLDGAIWKLRDGRVARILLRNGSEPSLPRPIGTRRRWRPVAVAVWAIAGVTLLARFENLHMWIAVSQLEIDAGRLQNTARRLAWLGQDSTSLWARVGQRMEGDGRPRAAMAAYDRAVRLDRRPPTWLASRYAVLLLNQESLDPRSIRKADSLARYLVRRLGDTRPEGHLTLAEVHARAGRWDQATDAAESALRVARATGDERWAADIERMLESYRNRRPALLDMRIRSGGSGDGGDA